jgi:propionyl-CoA carboxylase alpha chain
MFDKILIANRGEIACRIIRTARRLGIRTVAVFSDADAGALHVDMADEAVRLGPPPAAQSYLLAEAIVQACRATGAQAVHPGYGFLSERTHFAQLLDEAGIAFIGPPPAAIAAMGDKIESKRLAQAAGVSVVPGFVGEIEDGDHAARIAGEIGYPVMMKASAGGGGKGMRLAFGEAELREGFDAVRREAKAAFGDDRVFIEKFVEGPRHIEIQVLADAHGNTLSLFERECSIQRRHQKVIEEAPSPFVTPGMRAAMGAQAVALARAVGYRSAGTVEFIAGSDRSFYFLEMNTRLQVEHPVTEAITGLDLVEWMIRIAAGERLPFSQEELAINGWAIESRIYAEDPYRNFLPAIGRLSRYREPAAARVDTGVREGGEISVHYDPLIAKLITHGPTREAAIDAQAEALDRFVVRGPGHNIDFLAAIMANPRFREGALTTGFIAEEWPQGFAGAPLADATRTAMVAAAALAQARIAARAASIDGQLGGAAAPARDWAVMLGGERHDVSVEADDGATARLRLGEQVIELATGWRPGMLLLDGTLDGQPVAVQIDPRPPGLRLVARGARRDVRVLTPRAADLSVHMIDRPPPDTSRLLLSPMPGLLTQLRVGEGDQVEEGQPIAVVEAMKMENILRAPRAATVRAVRARPGASLAADEVILEFA